MSTITTILNQFSFQYFFPSPVMQKFILCLISHLSTKLSIFCVWKLFWVLSGSYVIKCTPFNTIIIWLWITECSTTYTLSLLYWSFQNVLKKSKFLKYCGSSLLQQYSVFYYLIDFWLNRRYFRRPWLIRLCTKQLTVLNTIILNGDHKISSTVLLFLNCTHKSRKIHIDSSGWQMLYIWYFKYYDSKFSIHWSKIKGKKDSATVIGYEGILRLWYEWDNTETKTRIFIIVMVSLAVILMIIIHQNIIWIFFSICWR